MQGLSRALKQRTLIMAGIDAFYLSILHDRNLTELAQIRKTGLALQTWLTNTVFVVPISPNEILEQNPFEPPLIFGTMQPIANLEIL